MINEMVVGIIEKTIESEYPHLKLPGNVYVKITSVNKGLADYSYETNMTINGVEESIVVKKYSYTYNVKILKEDKMVDERYAEIPNVKSYIPLNLEDIAVALLVYGNVNPFIVGKVAQ